jgi:hypothetical protein
MTTKCNMIEQYNFESFTPDASSTSLVERVMAAIYQEIKVAEYVNLSITNNGDLLVDNYKESIAIYLIPVSDDKFKVIAKSHDRNTLGKVQQTFKNADSITTEDVRSLIRTAVSRHEDKCRMLVSAA